MLLSEDHSDLILAQRKLPKQATKANTFIMKLVEKVLAFSPRHLKEFDDKFRSTNEKYNRREQFTQGAIIAIFLGKPLLIYLFVVYLKDYQHYQHILKYTHELAINTFWLLVLTLLPH